MNLSFEKVKKQHYVQRKLLANWKGGYCIYKNKSEYPFVFSENTTFYENDFYSYNNVTKEDYNFYYEKCHDIIAFYEQALY